jgi:hypothetical protein
LLLLLLSLLQPQPGFPDGPNPSIRTTESGVISVIGQSQRQDGSFLQSMPKEILKIQSTSRLVASIALAWGCAVTAIVANGVEDSEKVTKRGIDFASLHVTTFFTFSLLPQVSYRLFISTVLAPFIFFGVKSSTSSEFLDRATFEAITGGLSVSVCAFYFLKALKEYMDSPQFNGDRAQDPNLLLDCRIPSKFFLFLILPIVTTTAGTSFSRAKWLTVVNMSFYFGMISAMYCRTVAGCSAQCFHSDLEDKLETLANDAITGVLMVTVSYFACLPGAEIGDKYISSLYAGMEADNILNHVIKVGWSNCNILNFLLISLALLVVNRIRSRVQ